MLGGMLKEDVIQYYGTPSAAARAIGYTLGAVSQWEDGKNIPELSARKYHDITKGKLRFDSKRYANGNKRSAA